MGFKVLASGIKPQGHYIKAIESYPSPKNLTDVWSWFGIVNQVLYSFASTLVMLPFRHLLCGRNPFEWTEELKEAFKASKNNYPRICLRSKDV